MSERELRQLSELIKQAAEAKGKDYDEACRQIGKLIMRHCAVEPLVMHNTDTWDDDRLEAVV